MAIDSRLPFSVLQICRQSIRRPTLLMRPFSTSTARRAGGLGELGKNMSEDMTHLAYSKIFGPDWRSAFDPSTPDPFHLLDKLERPDPPHHLHIYAHKHNTHITLTNPKCNTIISKSTGNIGFRKSTRGTYDAAYQLSAYILGQIYESGLLNQISRLEVVLRGFGVGREAVTKALLGPEGRKLRQSIVQITDSTRLKFGGTRSRKPRRLG